MFKFSDQHIEEYNTLGYTVFRGIIPATLVDELRVQCDIGAAAVREQAGGQAQRFQPIAAYPVDPKPFEAFQDLAEVRDAVGRILQCPFEPSSMNMMGVLLEPADQPWCTQWHRDWRDNIRGLDLNAWAARYQEKGMFNQVNAALYEDSCTWVVPGSHLRPDTDDEVTRFPVRPIAGPELEGLSDAARERACLEYCESMPGAQRLLLDAGDYCLYRNTLWHLGNYIPYRKRATLHDGIMTPDFRVWFDTMPKLANERIAQGISWENPNEGRLAA